MKHINMFSPDIDAYINVNHNNLAHDFIKIKKLGRHVANTHLHGRSGEGLKLID